MVLIGAVLFQYHIPFVIVLFFSVKNGVFVLWFFKAFAF